MRRKALCEFASIRRDSGRPLDDWYRRTGFVDMRKTFPHADAVGEFTVFNIGGNKYRLATSINYRTGKVFIRRVLTHQEYSREDWKRS